MNMKRKFLLGVMGVLAYHNLYAATLAVPDIPFETEVQIRQKAVKLGAFVGGIKEGMEESIKTFAASTKSKEAADQALKGIKSGIDIAAAAASAGAVGATQGAAYLTGQSLPKFSSPIFDLGSLLASIIIAKREEAKAEKYARITKTLQTAAYTNPAFIQRLGSVAENVASTYASCITGNKTKGGSIVEDEATALSIGKTAGQTIVDYILNPDRDDKELQSFDIWEKHLLSIVLWGVSDTIPPTLTDAEKTRYEHYQTLSKRILSDPLEPVVAEAAGGDEKAAKRAEVINKVREALTESPAILYRAKRFLLEGSISKESSEKIIEAEIVAALENAGLINVIAAVTAAKTAAGNNTKVILEAILAPDASLTRRVYLQGLNPDDKVKYLTGMLDAPRAPELELLAYLLRKEFVRCLDFHSVGKPAHWTPSILNASAIEWDGRSWKAARNEEVKHGLTTKRPAIEATNHDTYGTRKYYPHEGVYKDLLDSEIELLNEMRSEAKYSLTQYEASASV